MVELTYAPVADHDGETMEQGSSVLDGNKPVRKPGLVVFLAGGLAHTVP